MSARYAQAPLTDEPVGGQPLQNINVSNVHKLRQNVMRHEKRAVSVRLENL